MSRSAESSDTDYYHFVFSTLRPVPKLTFQYNNPHAAPFIADPSSRQIRYQVSAGFGQPVFLELTKGILTLEYCGHLLNDLLKCHQLHPFRQRVSAESTPDYYPIIKHPMDLKTLHDRLYSGQITTVLQFKHELDLIWENCIHYHGSHNPLSITAAEVQKTIDEVWSQCEHPPPSHALAKLSDLSDIPDEVHADVGM
jgi:hypothetical protein